MFFGRYPQCYPESDCAPLEWNVIGRKEDFVLLLSKYVIERMAFHNVESETVTWIGSSLRDWLNHDFLKYFTKEEIRRIPTRRHLTYSIFWPEDSYCLTTNRSYEKVFLLTDNDVARLAKKYKAAEATKYARNKDEMGSYGAERWWLRNSYEEGNAAFVDEDGWVCHRGDVTSACYVGVRPALWVNTGTLDDAYIETAIWT